MWRQLGMMVAAPECEQGEASRGGGTATTVSAWPEW